MKGREEVDLGRFQVVLNDWVHFWESLVSFDSVQGMSGLRNLKVPSAFETKISRDPLCSRRRPWIISVTSFVLRKTRCIDSSIFPFVVS